MAGSNDQVDPPISPLQQKVWSHGAVDCSSNVDPAIEIYQYDQSSYILRQNKCLNFEAPFIYLLIGDDKVLVLDTGATESAADFPLYKTIRALVNQHSEQSVKNDKELLVIHSHSHSDHHAGDAQFKGQANVTLIEPNRQAISEFFAFGQSPDGEVNIELGGRKLSIIATPGHQEDAIAVYDPQTQWLLTGDTFYPGYVYVKNWNNYKNSITRLVSFSRTHEVSAVLGAHIEMTDQAGKYYPIGTIYQPNEASLVLSPDDLVALDLQLKKAQQPQEIIMNKFIVAPMSGLQKTISSIASWFLQ
jgi:glyoxylase-like metal-dependent hydrolase (beta-lactamase superfamily II)